MHIYTKTGDRGETGLIGADVADSTKKTQRINETHIKALEGAIDDLEKSLPSQKGFVVPGGSQFSAFAHLARTVCRRAERAISKLYLKKQTGEYIQIYINRLSDLLFMLART